MRDNKEERTMSKTSVTKSVIAIVAIVSAIAVCIALPLVADNGARRANDTSYLAAELDGECAYLAVSACDAVKKEFGFQPYPGALLADKSTLPDFMRLITGLELTPVDWSMYDDIDSAIRGCNKPEPVMNTSEDGMFIYEYAITDGLRAEPIEFTMYTESWQELGSVKFFRVISGSDENIENTRDAHEPEWVNYVQISGIEGENWYDGIYEISQNSFVSAVLEASLDGAFCGSYEDYCEWKMDGLLYGLMSYMLGEESEMKDAALPEDRLMFFKAQYPDAVVVDEVLAELFGEGAEMPVSAINIVPAN